MTEVSDRFDALIDALGSLGSPIGRFLRPGRAASEVESAVAPLGLAAPGELVAWFGRLDGPDDDAYQVADARASPLELFPGVRSLSLEQAVSRCGQMRSSAEDLGDDAELFWRPSWFPIVVGPESTFAVDCSVAGQNVPAAVWRSLSHPGPSETGRIADSLKGFLDRWIAEIRSGNVYWHPDYRSLEFRDDEAVRIEAAGLY